MRIYDRNVLASSMNLNNMVVWEQQVLSRVSSPYLMQLYEGMQSQENIFNVMTLCSGDTLSEKIKCHGTIEEESSKVWLYQIVQALTELNMFSYLPRVITNGCFRLLENNICVDIVGSSRN